MSRFLVCVMSAMALLSCSVTEREHGGCRYFIVHRDLPADAGAIGDGFLSEIADSLGGRGNDTLRLGVSVVLNILGESPEALVGKLRRVLDLSSRDDIPIYVDIDGQNWVDARPDLWNWWDPAAEGYDPANRGNVERYGWGDSTAVKVCWRDWGRQLRVRPALNVFAPRVVEAHREGLRLLLPVLRGWRDSLPVSRRYLFVGLRIGWEAGFNYNAYHYKGGNDLYEAHPDTEEFDPPRRAANDAFTADNNTEVLGHAAAVTSGIRSEGVLTNVDFERMTFRYLEMWCREAASYGFAPTEIYTHMGGNYAPYERHLRFWPAINRYSTPGWSLYSTDPRRAGSLAEEMASAGRTAWAATEWLWPADTAGQIYDNLMTAYTFADCRMVVYYNWGGLKDCAAAREAIRMLWR